MMEKRGMPTLNHVLQHTLRSLCCDTQWVYAVFWRILPRNYPPPKWENEGVMDRSKGNKRNWILVWEDGFCDFPACNSSKDPMSGTRFANHAVNHTDEAAETPMHPELFFKMSHEVYNYGEGLMGKVAADNSHKWVYGEQAEHEISLLSPWHGSLDPHPRTWEAQFKAGIQTIALISVREGLVQLGSIRKVVEDLNFVILMQRKFNYLQGIPGVFVPHPSPLRNSRTRDGIDSSPPNEGLLWSGSRDPSLIDGFFGRSNSDSGRLETSQSKHYLTGVLGMKRPPDNEIPVNLSSGQEFAGLSEGINFNASSRFDCRPSNGRSPECPSAPKVLNTGASSNSISLLPSMSSLHNLLSKLPSVTAPESNSISSSPSGVGLSGLSERKQSLPCQSSPNSSTDLVGRINMAGADQNLPLQASSSPGTGHPCGNFASISPQVNHDASNGVLRETYAGVPGLQLQQNSWRSSTISGFVDSKTVRDHRHPIPGKDVGPGTKDKLSFFLDSIDQDNLAHLELHGDLENSETYNSFLSEII